MSVTRPTLDDILTYTRQIHVAVDSTQPRASAAGKKTLEKIRAATTEIEAVVSYLRATAGGAADEKP